MTDGGLLVLGIGNILLGDEGVGVRAVEAIERAGLPPGCSTLDGGTGGLTLLEPMQQAERLIIIDATIDGSPAGTVQRLRPRFSSDYPVTLTAHDIGLKDLLDALYVLGTPADVSLYAVSIEQAEDLRLELSESVSSALPELVRKVCAEAKEWVEGRAGT